MEELGKNERQSQPTAPHDLKLKELVKHLKYVFLGEKLLQPDIISSTMSTLEEEKLSWVLEITRKHFVGV